MVMGFSGGATSIRGVQLPAKTPLASMAKPRFHRVHRWIFMSESGWLEIADQPMFRALGHG